MKDVADLARKLMNSTCLHVASNIYYTKDRHSFLKAMKLCYHLCSEAETGNDLRVMKAKLLKLRKDTPKRFNLRFEIFTSVRSHYLLGIDHSIEVIDSMLTRFVEGYSNAPEFFIANILERMANER